jgi:hypothetical protein
MEQNEGQLRLLTEIRDIVREHLEEYRQVTSQLLEIQRRAILRQEQMGRLYKVALGGCVLLVAAAVWYLSKFPVVR